MTFEEAAEAAGLRKASDREGTLRIVTIRDLDRSACGGTHVRATGEIGADCHPEVERVKQHVRLEFLCGLRAVRRARADADLLSRRLAGHFSAAADELPALLEAQRAELKAGAAAPARAGGESGSLPRPRAVRHRSRRVAATDRRPRGEGPIDRLRPLAQAIAAMPRALFVGWTAEPPAIVVATSADSGVDAGAALRSALEAVGGRGGGNPRLAQGTAGSPAAAERVVTALLGAVNR